MIVNLYRSHSHRRSGKQQISNLQCTKLAYVGDNLIDAEEHIARISLLHGFSVNIEMKI